MEVVANECHAKARDSRPGRYDGTNVADQELHQVTPLGVAGVSVREEGTASL
jgi:hypothetical protein